jgi:hypothetical protein
MLNLELRLTTCTKQTKLGSTWERRKLYVEKKTQQTHGGITCTWRWTKSKNLNKKTMLTIFLKNVEMKIVAPKDKEHW